jgi:nicotinate-nucleotide pyrophosphorylase (carboxylating)
MESACVGVGLPPWVVVDGWLQQWLAEDIGRGDRTTTAILGGSPKLGRAELRLKQAGIIAGLPLFERIFQLLDTAVEIERCWAEGQVASSGTVVATLKGNLATLLVGERVALNLLMPLSGIATLTQRYVSAIAELPTQLVDTRKTTPGLRVLQKYATQLGGAQNHRFGLDDAVMIKDNHIVAAGTITAAIALVRQSMPFPLTIEVETETLEQVQEAVLEGANIIMLDNMSIPVMTEAVQFIRHRNPSILIEASGNVTLKTIRAIAETGVDFISSSAPITQASWLDFSLKFLPE